jgi:hypothetical protein
MKRVVVDAAVVAISRPRKKKPWWMEWTDWKWMATRVRGERETRQRPQVTGDSLVQVPGSKFQPSVRAVGGQ